MKRVKVIHESCCVSGLAPTLEKLANEGWNIKTSSGYSTDCGRSDVVVILVKEEK